MKTLHIEVEIDEWGNYTYRDHTADTCHMSGRDTPVDCSLAVCGHLLESFGALTEAATKSH